MKEEISNYLELLSAMVKRDIKSQYDKAWFGLIWVIINPIIQMVIIGFVISLFAQVRDYYIFLLSGLVPWEFVTTSISKSLTSFVDNRAILHKARFSKTVIPFSIVISKFIQMLVAMSVVMGYLYVIGRLEIRFLPLLLIVLIWLLIITMFTALLVSSLHVRYRDIEFMTRNSVRFLFYITPILYSLSMIPKSLLSVYLLNPLALVFELVHIYLVGTSGYIIGNPAILRNIISGLLIISISVVIYIRYREYFVDLT